ncbi:MAG: MIT C-terminal domain-containing protein [Paludibacteraceae bacterium]|nr:MIT C-terminal domain-containing protein [Paludibacteraceae bacterium]
MAERYRKRIYCETQFLEECISKLNCSQFSFEDFHEMQLWKNIIDLIFSCYVKVHLNISVDEFESKVKSATEKRRSSGCKKAPDKIESLDDLYIEIDYKQQGDSTLHLKCSPYQSLNELNFESDDAVANSIIFTCEDDETCNEITEKYGVLVISPNNIKKYNHTLCDNGDALNKGEVGDWNKLLKNKALPCNCTTIIDNYILNDIPQIEENLTQILDSLLPHKLSIPFQVNIITALKKNKMVDLPSKERFEKIGHIAKKLRPNLNFQITICKCPSDRFHDRSIVTNSTLVICGGGFDLFKKGKTQKQTTVNIAIPYLNNSTTWINKAFSIIVSDIQKVHEELKTIPFTKDCFPTFHLGAHENRIFES